MHKKITTRQAILDICSMRNQAMKLLSEENDYSPLLHVPTEKDYYYDEDLDVPTLKWLLERTGLKYYKVRKQILKIYQDLVVDYDKFIKRPFSYSSVEFWFYIEGFRNYGTLFVNELQVVPPKGWGQRHDTIF